MSCNNNLINNININKLIIIDKSIHININDYIYILSFST